MNYIISNYKAKEMMIVLTYNINQKEKWEIQKTKGKLIYILFNTVILSVIIAIIFATFHVLIINRTLLENTKSITLTYGIYVITYGLIGIVIGNLSWKVNVNRFDR